MALALRKSLPDTAKEAMSVVVAVGGLGWRLGRRFF